MLSKMVVRRLRLFFVVSSFIIDGARAPNLVSPATLFFPFISLFYPRKYTMVFICFVISNSNLLNFYCCFLVIFSFVEVLFVFNLTLGS
jgi:hypothetical protein